MTRKSSIHGVTAAINEHRRELTPDGIPPSLSLSEWIHDIRFELEGIVGVRENEKRWHILRAIALGVMCLEEYGVPDTDGEANQCVSTSAKQPEGVFAFMGTKEWQAANQPFAVTPQVIRRAPGARYILSLDDDDKGIPPERLEDCRQELAQWWAGESPFVIVRHPLTVEIIVEPETEGA